MLIAPPSAPSNNSGLIFGLRQVTLNVRTESLELLEMAAARARLRGRISPPSRFSVDGVQALSALIKIEEYDRTVPELGSYDSICF